MRGPCCYQAMSKLIIVKTMVGIILCLCALCKGRVEVTERWGRRRKQLLDILLTFRHHASYIQDRCTATPHSTLFIYLINKYI